MSSGVNWTNTKAEHHINYLEMLAIHLGLQTLAKDRCQVHKSIMTDNTTAISVLNNSHSDACNDLGHRIWEWCIAREIWLSVAHIPGKQNLVADFESRLPRNGSFSSLHRALSELNFNQILICLSHP